MREYVFKSESNAKAARRMLIVDGVPVTLISYDPARSAYVFNAAD